MAPYHAPHQLLAADSDFMPINEDIELTQGERECVFIMPIDDSIAESQETFFVDLGSNVPLVELLISTVTVTIIDDEGNDKYFVASSIIQV